ncbi:MAG: hypothetical protein OXF93_03340 [Acidobacteria bacterium]|nr:hypothetical protein [Acidobacteriota bacterium]
MPDRPQPLEPRSRPWIWAVYVVLFAASVPWYLPAGGPLRIWLGLPHWVVISLAAYLAVAMFTAWVVARYWSVPADPVPGGAESSAAAPGGAESNAAAPGGAAKGDTARHDDASSRAEGAS